VLHSLKTGENRPLTSPAPASDSFPTFSPDGKTLAFTRSFSLSAREVMTIPVIGGNPQQLTYDRRAIWGLDWTSNGREIVFASNRRGGEALWRISARGGEPTRLAVTARNAYYPSLSRESARLAYTERFSDTNIYLRELPSGDSVQIIGSTREDDSPQFSPDGNRIAFVSKRTGSDEIWVADRNGRNQRQLTGFHGPATGTPRWSPDGKQIGFDSRAPGHQGIYVIGSTGGNPRLLTKDNIDERLPSWSPDGEWIYFCRQGAGPNGQLFKRPAAGGESVQLTHQGAAESFASEDGKSVYFIRAFGKAGVWTVPANGGEERQVPGLDAAGYWRYWGVVPQGIYFVPGTSHARETHPTLQFLHFLTGNVTTLTGIDKNMLWRGSGASLSRDRHWLAFVQVDQAVDDLIVIDRFK
jgi:Tol biopolymer transport system component